MEGSALAGVPAPQEEEEAPLERDLWVLRELPSLPSHDHGTPCSQALIALVSGCLLCPRLWDSRSLHANAACYLGQEGICPLAFPPGLARIPRRSRANVSAGSGLLRPAGRGAVLGALWGLVRSLANGRR